MKRSLAGVVILYLTLLAMPGGYSSVRTQSGQDGYWEFQNAENLGDKIDVFGDKSRKESFTRRTYDIKKHDGFNIGGAEGTNEEGRDINVYITSLKVPETIESDRLSADISGDGYATLTEPRAWPNFFKMKVEHDGKTASGQTLTGFGHKLGYDHVVKAGKQEDFSFSTAGLSLPKPGEDFTVRLMWVIDESNANGEIYTWTILFHYKWRTDKQPTTDKQTANSLSGRWFGSWTNSKDESGTSTINISEEAGTITGDEDGWVIENGRRSGDIVTWIYRNQSNGCRDYNVRWEISADGRTANGTYTVTDRCDGKTYTGKYINYHR